MLRAMTRHNISDFFFKLYLTVFICYSQELQEDLENQKAAVKGLNTLGEDLALQGKKDNEEQIKKQLHAINTQWTTVYNRLSEIKKRQVLAFLAMSFQIIQVWFLKSVAVFR